MRVLVSVLGQTMIALAAYDFMENNNNLMGPMTVWRELFYGTVGALLLVWTGAWIPLSWMDLEEEELEAERHEAMRRDEGRSMSACGTGESASSCFAFLDEIEGARAWKEELHTWTTGDVREGNMAPSRISPQRLPSGALQQYSAVPRTPATRLSHSNAGEPQPASHAWSAQPHTDPTPVYTVLFDMRCFLALVGQFMHNTAVWTFLDLQIFPGEPVRHALYILIGMCGLLYTGTLGTNFGMSLLPIVQTGPRGGVGLGRGVLGSIATASSINSEEILSEQGTQVLAGLVGSEETRKIRGARGAIGHGAGVQCGLEVAAKEGLVGDNDVFEESTPLLSSSVILHRLMQAKGRTATT